MHIGADERIGLTVFASNRAVIEAAARKLKPETRFHRKRRKARHAFYRNTLACDRAALEF